MNLVKLAEGSHELLERLADRFPLDQLASARSLDNAGEWGELIEQVSAVLVKRQIAVTPSERDALAALLYMYQVPKEGYDYISNRDRTLAALNVQQ